MSTYIDQLGRKVVLKTSPKKIISLVPSQSELLCDLALENELIGITKFCIHPYHLIATKTVIGGTKKVNIDKIKTLNPDFILCNKEENTLNDISLLEKIAPTFVSDVNSISDALDLIHVLGEIFNRRTESANLIEKINFKMNDFKEFIKTKPTRKVAYFIWANPYMVAANNTFINEMLLLNKFKNMYASKERYPEVDISRIRHEGDPKIVILSSEPYKFKDDHAMEIATYTNRSATVFADGEMFSWFGSRILYSFDYFKELHKHLESHF